ncbi:hypothetical protein OOT46_03985 [Aquabacterium sp. A7-Y]|uniref:hypothetical protein n=1 Tax=Aquabacterium sp. A7-Y TaxID=1349605 RepID=UPI00223D9E91|nr:hypothetical protein [Aquabacterium sp. A7-Y]MCW7537013.1 hypothetical protein [Aquabacterium sp. A7-Y]
MDERVTCDVSRVEYSRLGALTDTSRRLVFTQFVAIMMADVFHIENINWAFFAPLHRGDDGSSPPMLGAVAFCFAACNCF